MITFHLFGGVSGTEHESFVFGGVFLGAFGVELIEIIILTLLINPDISTNCRIPSSFFIEVLPFECFDFKFFFLLLFCSGFRPLCWIVYARRTTFIVNVFVFYRLGNFFNRIAPKLILINMLFLQLQFHF